MHFPLHPGLGPQGKALSEILRGVDLTSAHARLAAIAAAEGLSFRPAERAWDTRLAQELASWADERGSPLHQALFRAVFVEGRNIGDEAELVSLAAAAGLPAEEARQVLTERTHKAKVDADWRFSRQAGVRGVPTYAIGQQGVSGAQPYEVLEQLALQAGVERR